MVSLKGFYTVISSSCDAGQASVVVCLNAGHAVYQGHFPGQPVAPGAALTQMVVDEAARVLGVNAEFAGARQIKFLSVTDPNLASELELRYAFTERDEVRHFHCTGLNGETVFLKMNGEFR